MSIISERDRASASCLVELAAHPEVGLYPGQQLSHPERLGDEVGGAEAERANRGLFGRHGGDHENRQILETGIGLDPLQQLEAVHLGHHDVEQKQIELFRGQVLEEVLAARGGEHVVAVFLEDPGQGSGERLIVVRHEDLGATVIDRLDLSEDAPGAGNSRSGSTFPPLTTTTVEPVGPDAPG